MADKPIEKKTPKNSVVAATIGQLQTRFGYLSEHLDELTSNELGSLIKNVGFLAMDEKTIAEFDKDPKAYFQSGVWKEEFQKRLKFLADAPVEFQVAKDKPTKSDFGGVAIRLSHYDPLKNTSIVDPSKKGSIVICYNEELEKLPSEHVMKIMAHEFGHIWQPEANRVILGGADDYKISLGIITLDAVAIAAVMCASPALFGVTISLAVLGVATQYCLEAATNYISHSAEYTSDSLADIIVPEVRWRDTFKAYANDAMKDWDFKDNATTRMKAWAESMYNLVTLADPHPSIKDRILASERYTRNTDKNWVERVTKKEESAVDRVSAKRKDANLDKTSAI